MQAYLSKTTTTTSAHGRADMRLNRNIRDIILGLVLGALVATGLATAVAANASTTPKPKCPWNEICNPPPPPGGPR